MRHCIMVLSTRRRPTCPQTRPTLRAALGVLMIGLTACTGAQHSPDHADVPPSASQTATLETQDGDDACGTDVTDTTPLLPLSVAAAPRGAVVSRSASVITLDAETCHDVGTG